MKKLLSYIISRKKIFTISAVGLVVLFLCVGVDPFMRLMVVLPAQADNTLSPQDIEQLNALGGAGLGSGSGATNAAVKAVTDKAAADIKNGSNAPDPTKGTGPDDTGSFLATVVGAIGNAIIGLEGWIISVLTGILMGIMGYNDFVTSDVVVKGWSLTRDISNLFFVIVLLAIAIGTILRVESYNFKKLLPKVILMAVLVNFSLLICGFMLDFAQVIMMTFAAAFAGPAGEGQLLGLLDIRDILYSNRSKTGAKPLSWLQIIGSVLLAVVMLLITILVIIVMVAVMFMRVVFLWLLVSISPLAFILSAFPQGEKYAQQWWQEFTKYLIIGPVLAFFLWLTFAVASQAPTTPVAGQATGTATTGSTGAIGPAAFGSSAAAFDNLDKQMLSGQVNNPTQAADDVGVIQGIGGPTAMLSFIIGISLLMGSLVLTQQIGVSGAGFAGSMFNRVKGAGLTGVTAPFRAGGSLAALPWSGIKAGAGFIGGKWDREMARASTEGHISLGPLGHISVSSPLARRAAGFLSPTALKQGWEHSRHEAEREVFPQAASRMSDLFNKKLRGFDTYNERIAFQSEVTARQSEINKAGLSETEHGVLLDKAIQNKDGIEIAAVGKVLLQNNQFDDYVNAYNQLHAKDDGFTPLTHNPEELRDHLKTRLDGALGEEMSGNIGTMWSQFAEASKKFRTANYARSRVARDDNGNIIMDGGRPKIINEWLTEDNVESTPEFRQALRAAQGDGPAIATNSDQYRKLVEDTWENLVQSEWKTKVGRIGTEDFVNNKEGKAYLNLTPEKTQFYDVATGQVVSSSYNGYSEEGILRAETENDNNEASVVDTRRQKMQARYFETIGVEDIDGKKRLNLFTLADAFKAGRYKTATSALMHSGLSTTQIGTALESLKRMGVTDAQGRDIDFSKYVGTQGKAILDKVKEDSGMNKEVDLSKFVTKDLSSIEDPEERKEAEKENKVILKEKAAAKANNEKIVENKQKVAAEVKTAMSNGIFADNFAKYKAQFAQIKQNKLDSDIPEDPSHVHEDVNDEAASTEREPIHNLPPLEDIIKPDDEDDGAAPQGAPRRTPPPIPGSGGSAVISPDNVVVNASDVDINNVNRVDLDNPPVQAPPASSVPPVTPAPASVNSQGTGSGKDKKVVEIKWTPQQRDLNTSESLFKSHDQSSQRNLAKDIIGLLYNDKAVEPDDWNKAYVGVQSLNIVNRIDAANGKWKPEQPEEISYMLGLLQKLSEKPKTQNYGYKSLDTSNIDKLRESLQNLVVQMGAMDTTHMTSEEKRAFGKSTVAPVFTKVQDDSFKD